jgi:uncharacterized membrane protein (DUF2068 family)
MSLFKYQTLTLITEEEAIYTKKVGLWSVLFFTKWFTFLAQRIVVQ